MPDQKTLNDYSQNAHKYISDYESEAKAPQFLYNLAHVHFKKGGLTYDIGAGTGRDAAYLFENGFDCKAVEPTAEFIKHINTKYPEIKTIQDQLPALPKIDTNSADNIFCCTMLQHLPSQELLSSIHRLVEILKNEGVIVLSWRSSQNQTDREGNRLFNEFTGQQIRDLLISYGCEILFYQQAFSDKSRPEIPFYVIAARKKTQALLGIGKVQSIIIRDSKSSTYKFALLRAINEIAQTESYSVRYEGQQVLVPMRKIAKLWTYYYWNFAKNNLKQGTNEKLSIYSELVPIVKKLKTPTSDYFTNNTNETFESLEKLIAKTIIAQPVKYITDDTKSVFNFVKSNEAGVLKGYLTVPEEIWRDMVLYGHWIEQGLLLEWAKLSYKLNKQNESLGYYLDQLLYDFDSKRDNSVPNTIKDSIFDKQGQMKIENCVWSNKKINKSNIAIDHIIPFSSNRIEHLWNLVPTDKKINLNKSDKIPKPVLVKARIKDIQKCWLHYRERYAARFDREFRDGLSLNAEDIQHSVALDALIERVTHQVNIRGMEYWNGPK
jgi:SAM-dependent methyltransferase